MALTDPVPSQATDVFRRNMGDSDSWMNQTSGTVTNRTGKTMRPLPVISDDIEQQITDLTADINAAKADLYPIVKFRFLVDTYEITNRNELGDTATGETYRYVGATLPFNVTPAINPVGNPDFVQVIQTDHNNLTNRNAVGAHDASAITYSESGVNTVESALRDRAVYMTLAEAQAAMLEVGQYVRLTDRDFGLFIVRPVGLAANGFDRVALLGGLTLEYVVEGGRVHVDHLGAKGDGVTISTQVIQAAVTLAVSSLYNHSVELGLGIYVIDDTIDFYISQPPSGVTFTGVGVQSESASHTATAIKWVGANDRAMFKALGSAIRGLKFANLLIYPDGPYTNPTTPMKDIFHVGPSSGFAAMGIRFENLWVRGFTGTAFKLGDPENPSTETGFNGQMANSSMSGVYASGFNPDARVIWAKGGTSEDFYIDNLACTSVSGNDKKCFIETESGFYINIDGLLTDGIDENVPTAFAIKAKSSVSVYQWITEDFRLYETYFQVYDHPIVLKGIRMLSSAERYGAGGYDAIVWRGFRTTDYTYQSESIMEVTGSTLIGNLKWEGSANRGHLKTGGLAFAAGSGIIKSGSNLRAVLENTTNGTVEVIGPNNSIKTTSEANVETFHVTKGAVHYPRNSKSAITGTIDTYFLGTVGTYIKFAATGGAATIRGFGDFADGRYIILTNDGGTNNIIINHNDGATQAGAKVITPTGSAYTLAPNQTMQMIYDLPSAAWRIIN